MNVRFRDRLFRISIDPWERIRAFADLAEDPEDLYEILAIASMTDDIYRDAFDRIRLVAPDDRYRGEYLPLVMWPFARPDRSRFSDGSYGVWYAAENSSTAFREKAYHLAKWLVQSHAGRQDLSQILYSAVISEDLHNACRATTDVDERVYSADSYDYSNEYGRELKAAGANGILYDSVRSQGNVCIAVFKPRIISEVEILRDLHLQWDGRALRAFEELT